MGPRILPIVVTRARVFVLALGALLALAVSPAQTQAPPDIAVVVNADVQLDGLTMTELRRLWLGDREFWPGNVRVALIIRAPVARERDAAVQTVCKMTEAQFRQHWIGKVFRNETPSGPKIAYSREMALDQVSRTAGALTLVESPASMKGVKVLKIDGKSPGAPGYPLK